MVEVNPSKKRRNPSGMGGLTQIAILAGAVGGGLYLYRNYKAKTLPGQS